MTRKRFVKLMMSMGYSRNHANFVAALVPVAQRVFPRCPAPCHANTLRGLAAWNGGDAAFVPEHPGRKQSLSARPAEEGGGTPEA